MKAILVIDKMPTQCAMCPLHSTVEGDDYDDVSYFCTVADVYSRITYAEGKPDWCPLKEMPKERILPTMEVQNTNYGEEPWFSDGWNACLEEISR